MDVCPRCSARKISQYLGVVAEDGWVPNEEARAKLDQLGRPLSFFMAQSDERDDDTLSFEEKGVSLR